MDRRVFFKWLSAIAITTVALTASTSTDASSEADPVKALLITGDHAYHDWRATTATFERFLTESGRIDLDVTTTPSTALTLENLANYDVLILNYKDSNEPPADTTWSEENKQAFLSAVRGGTGLVVYHYAAAAFTRPENWDEFELAICGGWRTQGFHGPAHEFTVRKTDVEHPITRGAPDVFDHGLDELYSNSMMVPGNVVLATAYCDPNKPKGTGQDEAVIWVNTYGEGRVFHCALGHGQPAIETPGFQSWMTRGVEWAATGDVQD